MQTFRHELNSAAKPDRVVTWRIDRLRDGGFPRDLAETLARDARYDLHALLELTDRGCAAELAARILAPIAGERRSC
jgi:hypothetical protein